MLGDPPVSLDRFRLTDLLVEYGNYADTHPVLSDPSAMYTSEREYVDYLVSSLSQWLTLTPNVRAMHYSGRILKYDLLAVPKTPAIAEICQFKFFAIEVKYHLYGKKLKEITEAYFQAFEYRNTMIVDARFANTAMFRQRPGAVCLCSDYAHKWLRPETAVLSRTFGRRGVYGMWANRLNAVAFTDHGDVFKLAAKGWKVREDGSGHTALKFSSGVPEWQTIKFVLTADNSMTDLATEVHAHVITVPPPINPEDVLDDVLEFE